MKTALIWGAGGGIGQALARHLSSEGWQVLAAGRHTEKLSAQFEHAYDVELVDAFSVQSAVTAISQEVSALDLWVYAAGDIASLRLNEMQPQDWQRILGANLGGAFFKLPPHHLAPEQVAARILQAYTEEQQGILDI